MGRIDSFVKMWKNVRDGRKRGEKARLREDMGENCYMEYEEVENGFGGYHKVDLIFYKDGKKVRQITDKNGRFLAFPGVEHGKWEKELTLPFVPIVRFMIDCMPFGEDGLAELIWTVQPDGMYWMDDDGFGMENDEEIVLSAKMDKQGRLVTPFAERQ